jgi:hypothetical protein
LKGLRKEAFLFVWTLRLRYKKGCLGVGWGKEEAAEVAGMTCQGLVEVEEFVIGNRWRLDQWLIPNRHRGRSGTLEKQLDHILCPAVEAGESEYERVASMSQELHIAILKRCVAIRACGGSAELSHQVRDAFHIRKAYPEAGSSRRIGRGCLPRTGNMRHNRRTA